MEKKEIILERRAKVDGSIYQRDNLNVWYSIVGYVSRECIRDESDKYNLLLRREVVLVG